MCGRVESAGEAPERPPENGVLVHADCSKLLFMQMTLSTWDVGGTVAAVYFPIRSDDVGVSEV